MQTASHHLQEILVWGVVLWVFWRSILLPVSIRLAHPLSLMLLKRGRVKWAMRIRQYALRGAGK